MSVKTVSRSHGRTAPAAAAYRAGVLLKDERTGEIHDYTRKKGVEHSELVFPVGVNLTREELWNAAEDAEKRINSTVAREYELAFPEELNLEQNKNLAREFAKYLTERYEVAADICIHAPNKKGDERNYHAHILTTTRRITNEGLKEKTRILDDKKTREIEKIRAEWASLTNIALERIGCKERIDHRTLEAQGIERVPTQHIGVIATAMERRGIRTERGNLNREIILQKEVQKGIDTARKNRDRWELEKIKAKIKAEEELEKLRQKAEQERVEKQRQEEENKEMKHLFMERAKILAPQETSKKLSQMRDDFFSEWEKLQSDQRNIVKNETLKFVKEEKERIRREQKRSRDIGWER